LEDSNRALAKSKEDLDKIKIKAAAAEQSQMRLKAADLLIDSLSESREILNDVHSSSELHYSIQHELIPTSNVSPSISPNGSRLKSSTKRENSSALHSPIKSPKVRE
jgi:hypothetical protein